jgi:hypothetical protein
MPSRLRHERGRGIPKRERRGKTIPTAIDIAPRTRPGIVWVSPGERSEGGDGLTHGTGSGADAALESAQKDFSGQV